MHAFQIRALICSLLLTAVAVPARAATNPQPAQGSGAGPYVTLLFSRTAVTAASDCTPDDTGIARLDTVVAPALNQRGLHPTGTLETGPTRSSSYWCGHSRSTLYASWDLARRLASQEGWTFGS